MQGKSLPTVFGAVAATILFGGIAQAAAPTAPAAPSAIKAITTVVHGSYVEARSASVYAGACHYNGELTTAGREAMMAWRITDGKADGVELKGVRALAILAGSDNLGFAETSRRSVLYVDSSATPMQRAAIVKLLRARIGATLGTIASVQSAPLTFTESAKSVQVEAKGIASLNASRYPCAHCRMPAETWYGPLTPTKSEIAQGVTTGFNDKTLGVSWSQTASDNVYVGTFAL